MKRNFQSENIKRQIKEKKIRQTGDTGSKDTRWRTGAADMQSGGSLQSPLQLSLDLYHGLTWATDAFGRIRDDLARPAKERPRQPWE